jgi:hypothetical protein
MMEAALDEHKIAEALVDADREREVIVLYLERPARNGAQTHGFRGALLIQRLEGSRPHGRLCILNGPDRIPMFK